MIERPNRSSAYQYKLLERSVQDDFLSSFTNEASIYSRLNPFQYNENRFDLEDRIKVRFYQLLQEHATPHQFNIFKLYSSGLTQKEIAEKLKMNQSSITKCIFGNIEYKNGKGGKPTRHGGLVKKMKRVIEEDDLIQDLLTELQEDYS